MATNKFSGKILETLGDALTGLYSYDHKPLPATSGGDFGDDAAVGAGPSASEVNAAPLIRWIGSELEAHAKGFPLSLFR